MRRLHVLIFFHCNWGGLLPTICKFSYFLSILSSWRRQGLTQPCARCSQGRSVTSREKSCARGCTARRKGRAADSRGRAVRDDARCLWVPQTVPGPHTPGLVPSRECFSNRRE